MHGLILDTSAEKAFALLVKEGKFLHSFFAKNTKNSACFLSEVNDFLKNYNLSWKELGYIAVGTGPGSFLGTRIGVILAKTLCFGLNIPLISFCSLQIYEPIDSLVFLSLGDAKSAGVYALEGHKNKDLITYPKAPTLLSLEALALTSQPLIASDELTTLLIKKIPSLQNRFVSSELGFKTLTSFCFKKYSCQSFEDLYHLPIHYLRL